MAGLDLPEHLLKLGRGWGVVGATRRANRDNAAVGRRMCSRMNVDAQPLPRHLLSQG